MRRKEWYETYPDIQLCTLAYLVDRSQSSPFFWPCMFISSSLPSLFLGQVGVVSVSEAVQIADENDLILVCSLSDMFIVFTAITCISKILYASQQNVFM